MHHMIGNKAPKFDKLKYYDSKTFSIIDKTMQRGLQSQV